MAVNEVMIESRRAEKSAPLVPAFRKMLPSAFVIVAYLLIGLVAFWPAFPLSQHISGGSEDFILALWFLNWVPHALCSRPQPVLHQRHVCAEWPEPGAEQCRSLARPDQRAVRPRVQPGGRGEPAGTAGHASFGDCCVLGSANVACVAPSGRTGWADLWLLAYMVGHGPTHLSLIFVPLPPFIAFTVASILQRRGSNRRLGIQLGLLLTAQFLICPEVVATVAVLTIAAVACVAVRHPANVPKTATCVWRPVSIALLVTGVLLAYPVWMTIAGPLHITGPPFPTVNPYHNDLFSFVVPGPQQKISFGMRSLGTRLAAEKRPERGRRLHRCSAPDPDRSPRLALSS